MFDPQPLYEAILGGQAPLARTLTEQALAAGVDAQEVIDHSMIPAMDEVGRRFENCEYFVPELLISARAMKAALELLRPRLAEQGAQPVGRLAIGTVRGDLHDIGKTLVGAMLEGGGFEVTDLGVDVPVERFVEVVSAGGVSILALSALLTTTMPAMRKVIDALSAAGVRDRVKVMVGGAPLTARYAEDSRRGWLCPDGRRRGDARPQAHPGLTRRLSALQPQECLPVPLCRRPRRPDPRRRAERPLYAARLQLFRGQGRRLVLVQSASPDPGGHAGPPAAAPPTI